MVEIFLRAQLKNNKNGKVAQHLQQAVGLKGKGESQELGAPAPATANFSSCTGRNRGSYELLL